MKVAIIVVVLIVAGALSEAKSHHKVLNKQATKHVQASTKSYTKADSAKMEDDAGNAVLKLLDAKIGKKVEDAAKEVQRFLTEALGKHIKETTKSMLDKTRHHPNSYREHEGKAVLVNFKLPYVVTPIHIKKVKKPKAHAKHIKHPKMVVKPHPHKDAMSAHIALAKVHLTNPLIGATGHMHGAPYSPTTAVSHINTAAPSPSEYPPAEYTPCQGSCTSPCTSSCYAPDCCCCPQAAAPLPPPPPPPVYYPPPPPPAMQMPVQAPTAYSPCHPMCSYRCSIFCPKHCCRLSSKRSQINRKMENGATELKENEEEEEKEAAEGSIPEGEEKEAAEGSVPEGEVKDTAEDSVPKEDELENDKEVSGDKV